jgi:hypothetical protein
MIVKNEVEKLISAESPSRTRAVQDKMSRSISQPSNETVIRRIQSDSGSEVSQAALELYENGIDFGKGKEPTRVELDLDDSDDECGEASVVSVTDDVVPGYPEGEDVPAIPLTIPIEVTRRTLWGNGEPDKDFRLSPPEEEPRGLLADEGENSGLGATTEAHAALVDPEQSVIERVVGGSQEEVPGIAQARDQTSDDMVQNDKDGIESSLKTLAFQEYQIMQAQVAKKEAEIRARLLAGASQSSQDRQVTPRASSETSRFAFTHTTITTGSNPATTRQISNLRSRKHLRHQGQYELHQATVTERKDDSNHKILNNTQKSEPPAAIPELGIISVRAVKHTRERTKKLSARASAKEDMSPISTFTSLPRTTQDDIWLNEAMRDEAARLAVTASLERAKEVRQAKEVRDISRFRPIRKVKRFNKLTESHWDSPIDSQPTPAQENPPSEQKGEAVGTEVPLPIYEEAAMSLAEATQRDETVDQDAATVVAEERPEEIQEANSPPETPNEMSYLKEANYGAVQTTDETVDAPEPEPEAPGSTAKTRPVYLFKKMLQFVLALVDWYMELIQPCFEFDSDWWTRLRDEQSSWSDVVKGALALAGLLGLFMAMFWLVCQVQVVFGSD